MLVYKMQELCPGFREKLDLVAKDRLLRLFQSAHVPFFEALQPQHVSALAELCAIRVMDPGAVVFRQGDHGDAFYIVLHGTLDVECINAAVRKAFNAAASERKELKAMKVEKKHS